MRLPVSSDTVNISALIIDSIRRLERVAEQTPGARALPTRLQTTAVVNGSVLITFSKEFHNLSPVDRSISLVSLVYTLTSINSVNEVEIRIKGYEEYEYEYLGVFSRRNVLLTYENLPIPEGTEVFTLFYLHPTYLELVAVERELSLRGHRTTETLLIEELINPTADLGDMRRLIPSGVRLREIAIVTGNICHLNFAHDFLSQIENEEILRLTIYSILYTILENTNSTHVNLQFNGDRTASELYGIDLSIPITRRPPAPSYETGLDGE